MKKLTATGFILPLVRSSEIPSGLEPMRPWGIRNFVLVSAATMSNSGSIVTVIPETIPFKPQTRTFGKTASDIKKFLKK
jgi:hypothetical protein